MDEYIVGTGYRLASFSILDVRAGLAKPLPERWIGYAPLNFTYLSVIFWHDVDHVDYAPTNKLTAHLYVRSKRDDRNNYPKIYKIDHKLSWKNEVKRSAFSLFAHVHVVLLVIRGWNFRSKTANWAEHRRFAIFPFIFVVITWLDGWRIGQGKLHGTSKIPTGGVCFKNPTGGDLRRAEIYIDVPLVSSAFCPPNFTLIGNTTFIAI